MTRLSERQIRYFRDTGFIKVHGLIHEHDIVEMISVIERDIAHEVPPYHRNTKCEICRIDNIVHRDPIFMKVITSPLIIDSLESLVGPNIELRLNRHNHATVNDQGSTLVRLHRDVLQWTRSVVTAIIYLDESNCENGCTQLIPSSQYLPFVGTPNNGGTWMDEHSVYADLINQAIPVPMPRGGILLFDSLIFHTVGANTTIHPRRSVTFGFNSVDELCHPTNDAASLLIKGERLYRGNDTHQCI